MRELPIKAASARAGRAELVAVAITLALTVAMSGMRLCPDVSWQLWIAHHLRHGARLYLDIAEVNPPLWFWMAMPIDWLGETLAIRPATLLIGATGLAAALGIAATGMLTPHIPDRRRLPLLVFAACAILVLPLANVGQREQFALIAALPYAALAAQRRARRPAPTVLAVAVGLGGAVGFALKHYFLLAPGLLELWLVIGLGRQWRPARPETAALAAAGVAYGVAILLFAPDFLTRTVPLLRLAYGGTSAASWLTLLQLPVWIWLATVALTLRHAPLLARARPPLATALLIAGSGFALAYAVQDKGWIYQTIAASGCFAMALAALLAEGGKRISSAIQLAAPAVLALPAALGLLSGPYRDSFAPETTRAATGLVPGDSVAIVSPEPAYSWPLIAERGFRYPERYYGFWMLHAIIADGKASGRDPALAALGRRIVTETVQDFRCMPPKRIMFDRPQAWLADFDILAFFRRDPQFGALLNHYQKAGRFGALDVYSLRTPLPPPTGACRHGV